MSRGRKPHTDPPRKLTVSIPESTFKRFDNLLQDPLLGRTIYRAKSKIVAKLIADWLDRVERGEERIDPLQF